MYHFSMTTQIVQKESFQDEIRFYLFYNSYTNIRFFASFQWAIIVFSFFSAKNLRTCSNVLKSPHHMSNDDSVGLFGKTLWRRAAPQSSILITLGVSMSDRMSSPLTLCHRGC